MPSGSTGVISGWWCTLLNACRLSMLSPFRVLCRSVISFDSNSSRSGTTSKVEVGYNGWERSVLHCTKIKAHAEAFGLHGWWGCTSQNGRVLVLPLLSLLTQIYIYMNTYMFITVSAFWPCRFVVMFASGPLALC